MAFNVRLDQEMMFLKACPRCRGDLVLEEDMYGRYIACLQCGFIRDITDNYEPIVGKPEPVRELKAV